MTNGLGGRPDYMGVSMASIANTAGSQAADWMSEPRPSTLNINAREIADAMAVAGDQQYQAQLEQARASDTSSSFRFYEHTPESDKLALGNALLASQPIYADASRRPPNSGIYDTETGLDFTAYTARNAAQASFERRTARNFGDWTSAALRGAGWDTLNDFGILANIPASVFNGPYVMTRGAVNLDGAQFGHGAIETAFNFAGGALARSSRGKVDPITPRIDITNDFLVTTGKDGITTLKYGNPEGVSGIVARVDKEGILGFDIRSSPDHPYQNASGKDMFSSAMIRLKQEGISVNKIREAWIEDTGSVNSTQYLHNLSNGMKPIDAAKNTWTGKIAQQYGYTKVEKIDNSGNITYVTFGK